MKRWKDNNSNWKTRTHGSTPEKLKRTASGRWMTDAQLAEHRKSLAKKSALKSQLRKDIIALWMNLGQTSEYCQVGYPALYTMIKELHGLGGEVTLPKR